MEQEGKEVMKAPKVLKCESIAEAEMMATFAGRPVLCGFADGTVGRMHPSGKWEEIDLKLVEKVMNRSVIGEKAQDVSTVKSESVSPRNKS